MRSDVPIAAEGVIHSRTMSTSQEVKARLAAAIESRNPDALDIAVTDSYRVELPRDLAGLLADALGMDWHTRHEDIVGALQTMKDPETVDALYAAATVTYPYLDYDEFFGLARKCTWALADIGTESARAHLQTLSKTENATIAAYAKKRLDSWNRELARKVSV